MTASVGRDAGVVQAGRIRLAGRLAFFAWGTLHSLYVPGWRNRLSVDVNWIWSYATHRRAGLLLVGEPTPSAEPAQPPAASSGAPAAAASPPEERRHAPAKGGGVHAR